MSNLATTFLRHVPGARPTVRALRSLRANISFRQDYAEFRRMSGTAASRFSLDWADRFPCLNDRTPTTRFDRHYIYHTAWAARILAETRPKLHVDIASTLYFVGIVSAFVPVHFYDYRPANLSLPNLESSQADLMSLPFKDASVASLSCMHVVEHVGLGRYGEPLDPEGDLKAIAELKRVIAPGGSLLFVAPTGKPRIQFNAHRIYQYEQIVEYFRPLRLGQFAIVPDNDGRSGLIVGPKADWADRQRYGCGCYWFVKD